GEISVHHNEIGMTTRRDHADVAQPGGLRGIRCRRADRVLDGDPAGANEEHDVARIPAMWVDRPAGVRAESEGHTALIREAYRSDHAVPHGEHAVAALGWVAD